MTTYCDNESCRFCAIDTELAEGGVKVCTVAPIFIRVKSLKAWMLKCNTYKYRPVWDVLKPIVPIGFDGLYPGQIKPTVWVEAPAPVLPGPPEEDSGRVDTLYNKYLTVEQECDT
jgi:hypothetical protein